MQMRTSQVFIFSGENGHNYRKGKDMSLYSRIVEKTEYIAVVGMGYVGLPIAVAFAKKVNVIGFDINSKKKKHRLFQ